MGLMIVYLSGMGIALFLFWKRKLDRKCTLLVVAGSLAALCLHVTVMFSGEKEALGEIWREGKSGREKTVELEAKVKGEEGSEILRLHVWPQEYSDEELRNLSGQLWEELEPRICGKNTSLDYVTEDLYFPQSMEGYPFSLTWITDKPQLLSEDGEVGEDLPQSGELVEVRLKILREERGFGEEHVFYVNLFPREESGAFWRRLGQSLAGTEEHTRNLDRYSLPVVFEGKELQFYEKKKDQSTVLFVLAVAGAGMIFARKKQEEKEREEKRIREIRKEYPELITRMAMLIGAGMTISGAFRRIAGEYGKRRQKKEKPLYEEVLVTCREMDSGVSQWSAFQHMGVRCQLPCIVRFTALLNQYARSGAAGLKDALREETDQALRERKEQARCLGEEAGTKLLLPMILMLVLVMVIIMIPAFTSFGI